MIRTAWPLGALLVFTTAVAADNWPAWRGPTGQGYCAEKDLPTKWSDKQNVKWKIKLEHPGNSTPVIWGDRVFLTIANRGGSVRSLICFDRANGNQLWKKDVEFAEKERNWTQDWYCNASPTTDGERVIVSLGGAGMYCYDFAGKELWKRADLGPYDHMFGNGSSPILYGDLCILWVGPNAGTKPVRNYLLAVNKKTGKTEWETDEKMGSWGTPVLVKVDGKDQLLLGMSNDVKDRPDSESGHLKGYDPKTGKELWACQGMNSYVYTSALYGNGIAVGMCGYNGSAIAVKLGGKGDITKDRLWQHPRNIQRVGSGIIVGEHVYMVDEEGQAHCYELATGKDLWKERVQFTWGSMVHADGKLWLLCRNGETVILKADPKFEVIATNSLGGGENTNSSLAISNGEIFIRTNRHLWCISDKK